MVWIQNIDMKLSRFCMLFLCVYYILLIMIDITDLSQEQELFYTSIRAKRENNADALWLFKVLTKSNNLVFLTGKAWTGKSSLISDVVELARQVDNAPLVLWSTGVSALNIGWQTVHSFFSLWIDLTDYRDIQHFIRDKGNKKFKLKKSKVDILIDAPFIVIDEVSMIHSNVLDCINFMMKYYISKKTGDASLSKKPFGWKQIVFVWDLYQLPPVANTQRYEKFRGTYASEWFFDSKTFKSLQYNILELKKSYRQTDDMYFSEILDAIRHETFTDQHLSSLNKQSISTPDQDMILLSTHNYKVDDINKRRLAQLPWETHDFLSTSTWAFPNSMKKVDDALVLKKWAKVVMLCNDVEGRRVNWSLWFIKDFSDDFLKIDISWVCYNVNKHKWENKTVKISDAWKIEEDVLWTYSQYPIRLAYAITIHKSQWLTFDTCQLDISNAFSWWQAYVALSRARSLSGIKLLYGIKPQNIFFNPVVKKYMAEVFHEKLVVFTE